MNGRLIALGAGMLVLAVWLARPAQVTPPEALGPATAVERPRPGASASSAPPKRLARDPFRYRDDTPAHVEPVAPFRPREAVATPVPATAPAISLSGFVRRGPQLKAVLSVAGTTLVVGAGEAAEGYSVVSIDEDVGVRVRTPTGEELLLRPTGER